MLEIVKQVEDFKLDNGIATDVIARFPYPTYVKDGFTCVSNPNPTGFVIQFNGYSACLIEVENGAIVSENHYILNIAGNFGPATLFEVRQKLEACKTIDEAREILESVRMMTFTSVDDDVDTTNMTELFSFTTDSGPIAYWIGADSVEKEAENGSHIRVYSAGISADYLAVDYSGDEGKIVMHIRKNNRYIETDIVPADYGIKIPPDCTTVMYISALFSAIAKTCVDFDINGDVMQLQSEVTEIIKLFDYDAYISQNSINIMLPGGISADDKNYIPDVEPQNKFDMAATMAGNSPAEFDDNDAPTAAKKVEKVVEVIPKVETEKGAEKMVDREAVKAAKTEPVEDTRGRRATNLWLTASLFDKTPEEIASIPIHNYTGHPVRFIDNAIKGADGRMTLPPEGPNVILDLPPEGRLSSANTYIDLGYVQGVPVSDIAPVKISAIPKLDGIIIVSPVYFNDALRAGFDMSNLYTLNVKIKTTGKNGKPEFYYVGLTKRF